MCRRFVLAAVVAALALPSTGAAKARFSLGVAAGEVSPTAALLWTRAPGTSRLTVELAEDLGFRRIERRLTGIRVSRAADFTVRVRISRLRPGRQYFYRFRAGAAMSPVGRFRTAPAPTTSADVRFAISGDADASRAPGATVPFFNTFGVYARMASERNHFNINLGDTIYSDTGVGGRAPALTVPQKWAMYRQNWALPAHGQLRAAAGLYSHWDDHEFVNDFSRPEHGDVLYQAGVKAFLDYAPVGYSTPEGLYRTFRWGRNLELFFLDERSFRDAKASAGGTCGTPPDLAPTAPLPVRSAFASLVPSLAQPVSPACLARIRDPARTMLGTRQLERFTAEIRRSTATFKVIVNETPIQQFYALPYDRWEGYVAERLALIQTLREIPNVVFLTTDTHANFVGDVRLQTLEPGGPVESGMLEVVTGPVATNTFAKEIDAVVGGPGSGTTITALFFKPAPPRGIGMRCAATDVYSYAEVRVTGTSLTITPKDVNGELVREPGGAPCGPFVVQAR